MIISKKLSLMGNIRFEQHDFQMNFDQMPQCFSVVPVLERSDGSRVTA
jgi:hypothetical protein